MKIEEIRERIQEAESGEGEYADLDFSIYELDAEALKELFPEFHVIESVHSKSSYDDGSQQFDEYFKFDDRIICITYWTNSWDCDSDTIVSEKKIAGYKQIPIFKDV